MDLKTGDAIPETYREWFRADLRHANEWRQEAQLDYDYRDGRMWSDTDKRILEDRNQAPIVFNGIASIIDAVSGQEISNRQEVRYIPREEGDALPNELMTSAALWFRDRGDADDNDSEAFRDTLTAGMGWTETRLDYEDNPDGDGRVDRIDPFEMVWDYNARKNNLIDATRVWRVRCLPIAEARAFAAQMGIEDVTDTDLHAEWAASAVWDAKSQPHVSESAPDRMAGRRNSSGELEEAVVVHCMWVERVDVWRVPMPQPPGPDGAPRPPKPTDMSAKEYESFKAEAQKRGIEIDEAALGIRKRKKKVRYQAFLGNVVLKAMPTACPEHFNFKCITGKRDQTKGQFYGMVRAMRDPNDWENKLYSQILHIINSSAKGGIGAERGQAFDNDAEAEESWARNDRITWFKPGALSGQNPKWMPKPVAQVPAALNYLLEYAANAKYKVSGVNLEFLGMRDAEQAGVLEYQRRQAGLIILQAYFDNLRAYRREQGELILWYVQNDLADGRLIRIVGKQKAQYVPLIREADLEYDIIVDDAPTSPNQKEKNWQLITQMLPVIKDMLTPEVMLALAEYSPLPSDIVQKLQELNDQASQSPAAKLQEKMGQLEAMVLETKAALQAAQAEKAKADAQKAMTEQPADPNAELAIKEAEARGKLALKQQEVAGNLQLKQAEMRAGIAMQREKLNNEAALRQQQMQVDQALQVQGAQHDMAMAESTAAAEQRRADMASQSDIRRKDAQAKAAARRPKPKPAK
jgi:hypothetical protein